MALESAPLALTPALVGGAGLYLTGDEQLRLTAFNSLTGVTLTLAGRLLNLEGRVKAFSRALVPATDRTASVLTFAVGEGWLIDAQVVASAGAPLLGQTFARLSLVRGLGATVTELATLAAGDVTALQPLAYPGAPIRTSLDGAGALRTITGTTPAAGAEIAETVPTGALWELRALRAQFVTDANPANRIVQLLVDDGTSVFLHSIVNVTQTAGITHVIAWVAGMMTPFVGQINALLSGFPLGLRLGAGYRLRTSTAAIQVGDQYSAVRYLVREWIAGA